MTRTPTQRGFTIIEMMIVIAIIAILAALIFPRLSGRDEMPRLMTDVAARVRLRRAEARRLAPQSARTALLSTAQPPVSIDFARPQTTAPLRIDGVDANGDGTDDQRLVPLTRVDPATGLWSYAYDGSPVTIPGNWRLTSGTNITLPPGVDLIKGSAGQTMGVPVSAVAFDAEGRAFGDRDGDGVAESAPDTLANQNPAAESPFWALYFTDSTNAFAVAVHATGYTETWKWDPKTGWRGFAGRTPEN